MEPILSRLLRSLDKISMKYCMTYLVVLEGCWYIKQKLRSLWWF